MRGSCALAAGNPSPWLEDMHFLPSEANRRCANHRQLHGFEREMFGKRDQANADRLNARYIPAAQSKWGRYCYRPHSYQRVVFSSGEPSKKRLALDVSSPNGLGAYRHRRSHRHPVSLFS
jgi:hypothetical protein